MHLKGLMLQEWDDRGHQNADPFNVMGDPAGAVFLIKTNPAGQKKETLN